MPPHPKLLEVDSRRRISLGALALHDYYLVDVAEDGVLTLTPAVIMPAATAGRIDSFLDDPSSGTGPHPRPRLTTALLRMVEPGRKWRGTLGTLASQLAWGHPGKLSEMISHEKEDFAKAGLIIEMLTTDALPHAPETAMVEIYRLSP